MIERRPITDREQWLAWRREDITASNAGALLVDHPFTTPMKLYAEKRGIEFEHKESKIERRGRWLEPAIERAVAELRPDWSVTPAGVYVRDGELRLGATPDFIIHGDPRGIGILQGKSVNPSIFARQWDEGREVPDWIKIQTMVERMLWPAAFAVVAVMIVSPELDCHLIEIPADRDREAQILEAVKLFWTRVDEGIEPEPNFAKDSAVIRALTSKATAGKTVDLYSHNELPEMLEQRVLLKERMKRDDERCTEIENEVKFMMGDAELAALDGWRITYKVQHISGYTVQPRDQRKLLIYDKRMKDGQT